MARTRIVLVVLLALTCAAVAQNTSWKLEIGEKLPRKLTFTPYPRLCTTAPGNMDPCRDVTVKDVDYTIAWNVDSRTITYIYTEDPTFQTEDKLAVNSKLTLTAKDIKAYPGWLIVGPPTKDGWLPVIGRDKNVPRPDSQGKIEAAISGFVKMK